ncbi:MAG: Crp/Fnr family transcriptional regulator [Gammaproteobacteria bacterium]|nr:MAG: Crp/Fnr family transcriptional regulator [Gammaproteobacteria bacterium]RTZ61687.1 MAG: Crp/Fnr family transcriptional regulator [Gammaproteobacteria bacterium]
MDKLVDRADAWQGVAHCESCNIRNSVLFSGLEEKDFEQIHTPIIQNVFEPGDMLYREGESAKYIYTIRSGLVKLVHYLPDGGQRIVRLVKSTDVTGLEALLGNTYGHDAVVLQRTEICRLPIETVNDLARHNATLHAELLQRWQTALEQADLWLAKLATGSARQRVAQLLLWLNDNFTKDQCCMISREDMGAMLGITTETASRTVAGFKRNGLIVQRGHKEFACDVNALKSILDE